MKKILQIVLAMVFLSSCSVVRKNGYLQSRKYKPGEAFSKVFKAGRNNNTNNEVRLNTLDKVDIDVSEKVDNNFDIFEDLTVSKVMYTPNLLPRGSEKIGKTQMEPDSIKCDTIYLKDGRKMIAHIVMYTSRMYKFQFCGSADTTVYTVSKYDVDRIGSTETGNNSGLERKSHPKTFIGFLLGIGTIVSTLISLSGYGVFVNIFWTIIGLFLGVLTMIYLTKAQREVRMNPEKYRGRHFIGFLLGIGYFFWSLLLISIISSLG